MDAQLRILLEVTYEAIVDAGKYFDQDTFMNNPRLIRVVLGSEHL